MNVKHDRFRSFVTEAKKVLESMIMEHQEFENLEKSMLAEIREQKEAMERQESSRLPFVQNLLA